MSARNGKLATPESVTNRPMRARLLAEGGTIRGARRELGPSWWLMCGVLLGILMCLALSLWREAERERAVIVPPLTQPREASHTEETR